MPECMYILLLNSPFQGQKKRHQLMHSISQVQVWSSCRFLQPDLLSAMKSVHFSIETTTLLPPQVILSFCPSPLQPLLQERLFLPRLRQRPPLWLPSLLGMLQIFISSALRALYTWHLGVSSRVTFMAGPCLTTSYLPAKRHHRLFSFYLFRLFPTAYYSLEVTSLIYLLIGLFSISTLPP